MRLRRCWVAALSALVIAMPLNASESKQEDLARLRQQIKELTDTLNRDQEELSWEQSELVKLEQTLSELNRKIVGTQSKIVQINVQIIRSEGEIAELARKVDSRKDQLKSIIVTSYIIGRAEFFKLLLNQEDPNLVGRNMAYYRYLSRQRVDEILEFKANMKQLDAARANLSAQRLELSALQADQLTQQSDLEQVQLQRYDLINALERNIGSNLEQLDTLKSNAKRLERLIRDLQGMSSDVSLDGTLNERFGNMRGRLPLPVKGDISAYFGEFKSGSDIPWEGIFLDTDEGTTVRAVFPGRVAYADWLRGFGLLLILDHGDGFMSLYSHNKLLFKQVGEWADTGEILAQTGAISGQDSTGLYFEIRQNGEPRDPLIWCKVE